MARGGPIRTHHTDTVDKDWSGPSAETKLDAEARDLRQAHAWADPSDDEDKGDLQVHPPRGHQEW